MACLLEEAALLAPHQLRLPAYLGDSDLAIEADAATWQAHCKTALGAWTKGP